MRMQSEFEQEKKNEIYNFMEEQSINMDMHMKARECQKTEDEHMYSM